jgi:pyridoxamine 5'-phosphate oxidase
VRGLSEDLVRPDPIEQFRVWFEEAGRVQPIWADAMTLATAGPDGRPSARAVILRGFDHRGFSFYTDRGSPKARDLAANPWGALVFLWAPLQRQVRVEGPVSTLPPEESDAYFRTRPRGSRLAAWAGRQSRGIDGREELERRMEKLRAHYRRREVPRPPYWGGYRLEPRAIEFWQGRANRLHDRLRYRRLAGGGWRMERLAP